MLKKPKKIEKLVHDAKKSITNFDSLRRIKSTNKKKTITASKKIINLSLVRSPISTSKKQLSSLSPYPQVKSLKTISTVWLSRFKASTPTSYFHDCRAALQDLSKSPHPVGQVLKTIQKAYEEKLSSPVFHSFFDNFNETHEKREENKRFVRSSQKSFLKRLQMRRFSSRRNEFCKGRESESLHSVPKLKIGSLNMKLDTEKATGTTNESPRGKIQDYQDEFMSKFPEFSESWRQQILQQSSYLRE